MFDLRWKTCFISDENLVVFHLVFHWVSRFIHLTEMEVIYWLLTAWLINEFENAYATMTSVLYDLKSKIYEIVFKWKVKVRKVFFPFIVFALNFHSTINAYSIPFHWLHCYFDLDIIIIMFRFLQQKFNSLPHRKKVIHLGQFVRAGCNQHPEKSVLSSEPVCNPLFQGHIMERSSASSPFRRIRGTCHVGFWIDLTWTTKAQNKAREIAKSLVITSDCYHTSQLSLFRLSDSTTIDGTKCDTTDVQFRAFLN